MNWTDIYNWTGTADSSWEYYDDTDGGGYFDHATQTIYHYGSGDYGLAQNPEDFTDGNGHPMGGGLFGGPETGMSYAEYRAANFGWVDGLVQYGNNVQNWADSIGPVNLFAGIARAIGSNDSAGSSVSGAETVITIDGRKVTTSVHIPDFTVIEDELKTLPSTDWDGEMVYETPFATDYQSPRPYNDNDRFLDITADFGRFEGAFKTGITLARALAENTDLLNPGSYLGRKVLTTLGAKVVRKLQPYAGADGRHTTWKTDSSGRITRHETWEPNPRSPRGADSVQSTDLTGSPHRNSKTGQDVPVPHTQGRKIPGGVRPASPDEIP